MSVALVSVPGYGHSLLPGALPTLSAALAKHQVRSTCYFFCAEFSDLLMRRHQKLIDIDRDIAQWSFTYHEVFFHDQIKKSAAGKTLFPLPDGFEPSGDARKQLSRSPKIKTYCAAMLRHLRKRAREIAQAGHRVIGFSCSQNSQFYTALYVALEIRRHAATPPAIVFGGGLFDAGNVARFASAFPMIDSFIARDGVDALLNAVRSRTDGDHLPRNIIGPPPRTSMGWSSVMRRAPNLPKLLLRHRGYFQLVVSASRGCSWAKCKFCCHAVRERHSYLDPVELATELKWLNRRYGITGIIFGDLEMNPSLERVRELADALSTLPKSMSLWGLINSRWIGAEVFRQFREARFLNLQCGIEALNQPILDRMRKGTTVLNNVMVMRLAHEIDLEWLFAPLLEGFSGETPEDVKDTLSVIRTIPHLLRAPVDAEVVGCFRHRGAWLGSKLTADEPELGSSRWFDPDEIAIESPNAKLWSTVRKELENACRGKAFLKAKSYPGLTRIVDGRNAKVRVYDFSGMTKHVLDAILEGPQTKEKIEKIAGAEYADIIAELEWKKLILSCADAHLCVAVRTEDLENHEYSAPAQSMRRPKCSSSRRNADMTLRL